MNPSHAEMSHSASLEIAIIGMAGRFPGARNIDQFWDNLQAGFESITFYSEQDLISTGIGAEMLANPNYVRAKGQLDGADLFDACFFKFTPREARITDPQHRLFLECAWEALENAGYLPDQYQERIGVFAGASSATYLGANAAARALGSADAFQVMLGNEKDFLTTRVSYKLNLRGPSIAVQSACSSSLVAIHLACQSLLSGECEIALAGGVSVTAPLQAGYMYREEGIGSPDGHCRAFDTRAQGTVPGNGVGIVVLKRLQDALADRDYLYARIRGSAINNDGASKIGYTAPSVDAQTKVIQAAQCAAEVSPDAITYVEAHGTGTSLGDAIEIDALNQAFHSVIDRKDSCCLGSVKTNVGHLDVASGVTGLIKAVLALKHKQIPPSLHFRQPNPQTALSHGPFYVNSKLLEWTVPGGARIAGVSSFGTGGTNAHVILEEPPARAPLAAGRSPLLWLLSGKTRQALDKQAANLAAHVKQCPDLNLSDAAYSLQVGRSAFAHRRALVCSDRETLMKALEGKDPSEFAESAGKPSGRIAFLFPGQLAQHANMGRELYEVEKTFRNVIDRCSEWLRPLLGVDLKDLLYPRVSKVAEANEKLACTTFAQPALFVIEYALAQLWAEWGIRPASMLGNSLGEYVAATLAGVFSLETALHLVTTRAMLARQLLPGSMLEVSLPERDLQQFLHAGLSIAVVTSPVDCVVAGESTRVEELQTQLVRSGIRVRRVTTSHAFHSRMMEPVLMAFGAEVAKVKLSPPTVPYVSNVSGRWITPQEATDPQYWVAHLRQRVQLTRGFEELLAEPAQILLEVGPLATMSSGARRQLSFSSQTTVVSSLPDERESEAGGEAMLKALGRLWLAGQDIEWDGFHKYYPRNRVPLPAYPFERERFWLEPQDQAAAYKPSRGPHGSRDQSPELH